MISHITAIFSREIDTLRQEIEAYPDDAAVWKDVSGMPNPAGTLALHLAGNLQHYIGARLGGSAYLRNRAAEFERRHVPRQEILSEIETAAHVVPDTLGRKTDADLGADFPEVVNELTFATGDFLLHLASHLSYHLGQIDYHRRAVTGGKGLGALPMARLASARREGGAAAAGGRAASGGAEAAEQRSGDVILNFDLDEGVAILERTPRVLRALLEGLPEAWITANEGPKTWSPFDVVGHLIDGEEHDWIARTRIIVEEGPGRTFDPFNRFGHLTASRGKPLGELLDRFESLRSGNVATVRELNLGSGSLDSPGTHPDFGRVTLRELLATWVVHDLGHIAQVTRTMAGRYRADVGPWYGYLPALHPRKRS